MIVVQAHEIMSVVSELFAKASGGTVSLNPDTLPTSPVGLKPGSLWNNGGVVSIVLKTLVPLSSS